MAEHVQLRLESTLPELEEMERIGLFTSQEIKKIIKKRRAFEYQLHRKVREKMVFVKYIQSEINILSLIKKRRERLLCDYKKKEIDHSIAKRINKLFKIAVLRFQGDVSLWLDQINFCKRMKWYHSISGLYTRMLQVHSLKPSLWIKAAKWEMEENKSPENARGLMQRGLRFNPKSQILWREYFRMELMHSDLVRKRRENLGIQKIDETEENDAILDGTIALVVFDNAIKEIPDDNFGISFSKICQEFDFTKKHYDHIFEKLLELFPTSEEVMKCNATRILFDVPGALKNFEEKGFTKIEAVLEIVKVIWSNYEKAVEMLPTEKMYSFYLDFLSEKASFAKGKNKIKKHDELINIMQKIADRDCLSLKYYNKWVEFLQEKGDIDSALNTSLIAARKWKQVKTWHSCLSLHIQKQKESKEIFILFEEALASLKEQDTLPLWLLIIEWATQSNYSQVFELYERGIRVKDRQISIRLKEMYLEFVVSNKGFSEAQKLFKRLKIMHPISAGLFKIMIHNENMQPEPSLKNIRSYYQDALREFGSTDVDLWLDCIKFELNDGNPSDYGQLYSRAIKTLDEELIQLFLFKISVISIGDDKFMDWDLLSEN